MIHCYHSPKHLRVHNDTSDDVMIFRIPSIILTAIHLDWQMLPSNGTHSSSPKALDWQMLPSNGTHSSSPKAIAPLFTHAINPDSSISVAIAIIL